ncbi:MAG: hypothetical protein FWB96_08595 [Defluviitaleaceae bacterium]|nr:hypothetical protein [Defluviitaleaceae bacterium]MCL2262828.1 hypothetical protein [Defluviitaleaceae bacterium]
MKGFNKKLPWLVIAAFTLAFMLGNGQVQASEMTRGENIMRFYGEVMPMSAGAQQNQIWFFGPTTPDGNGEHGGGTWAWAQSTGTLTLTNLTLISDAFTAIAFIGDAAIVLNGANHIESTFVLGGQSTAIFGDGNITLSGSGSLTAIAAGGSESDDTIAIYSEGDVIVESGITVNAVGGSGGVGTSAGIASWGNVIVNGGTVTSSGGTAPDSRGIMGNLNMDGNGVVFASSTDTVVRNNGILFDGNSGTVYGNVTLEMDLTIPNGYTLTVPSGTTIVNNAAINNSGTINNLGTINNVGGGTIIGNPPVGDGAVLVPTPPTGIADITSAITAMFAFLAISAVLWGFVLRGKLRRVKA